MNINYYHRALVVIAVCLFFTNVPQYIYERGYSGLEEPKHWILLFCLLLVPLLLRQTTAWSVLKSPLIAWAVGYALVSVLWFLLSSQAVIHWQELKNRFLAIIEIGAFLLVFWHPSASRLARKTLVAMVLMAVAFNIYELFVPMSFSKTFGRAAGLYQNPNFTAEALVLGMLLSVTMLRSRYRTPYVLLVGVGVFVTLSRGGILTWSLAVAGLLFMRGISSREFVRAGAIASVLVILVLLPRWDGFLKTWEQTGVLNSNVMGRLTWLTDPSGTEDASSWERKYVAKQAWIHIAESPILGSGTGSSYQAFTPPHNQYLALMIDHGLIGIILVPLLIVAITYGGRGQNGRIALLFGGAMMLFGLFTHKLLYANHLLLLLPLVAAMTASSRHREVKRIIPRQTREPEAVQVSARA